MIQFTTYATPSAADIAEQLCEEPEDFATVLAGVASMIEDDQRDELHVFLARLEPGDKATMVDMLLRMLTALDGLKAALTPSDA